MKTVIVYLIRGRPQKYQKLLIKKLANISGEKYVSSTNPLPQHVTLKPPFQVRDMKKLEKIVRGFAKNQKKSLLKMEGFGNFNKLVIFLKIIFPRSGKKIQKNLVKLINTRFGLKEHRHEKKWKPHATLVYGNTPDSFNRSWNYLRDLKIRKFEIVFDNIAILIKPENRWKIYKIYPINKN